MPQKAWSCALLREYLDVWSGREKDARELDRRRGMEEHREQRILGSFRASCRSLAGLSVSAALQLARRSTTVPFVKQSLLEGEEDASGGECRSWSDEEKSTARAGRSD